jgi:hypothetical protein
MRLIYEVDILCRMILNRVDPRNQFLGFKVQDQGSRSFENKQFTLANYSFQNKPETIIEFSEPKLNRVNTWLYPNRQLPLCFVKSIAFSVHE